MLRMRCGVIGPSASTRRPLDVCASAAMTELRYPSELMAGQHLLRGHGCTGFHSDTQRASWSMRTTGLSSG